MRYKGGYNTYGISIGVMLTNKRFARIPGDVGNATTFDFPVRFRVVKESTGDRHRRGDPALLEPYIAAAKELDTEGVRAITTSCGFLGHFQNEIAKEVKALVYTSSLLQLPLVYRMLRPDQKVGVITADAPKFNLKLLESVGAKDIPVVFAGLEEQEGFLSGVMNEGPTLDFYKVTQEVVKTAEKLVSENPDIGAIVLECANLPPYSKAIQDATGLPVFDILTLTRWVHSALVQQEYQGYL
jgi:Asp/Glu/hydantoin racemase